MQDHQSSDSNHINGDHNNGILNNGNLNNGITNNSKPTTSNPFIIKKSSKHHANKKLFIYSICFVASIAFIAVIVWVVVSILNKPAIDEDFFVSDDTKTTIDISAIGSSTSDHKTRTVYEYDDDGNVISMKTYFEYTDADVAKNAYELLKNQPEFKNSELKDKYIIITSDESQYKGLTASDIRQQADAIRAYQAQFEVNTSDTDDTPSEEPLPEENQE